MYIPVVDIAKALIMYLTVHKTNDIIMDHTHPYLQVSIPCMRCNLHTSGDAALNVFNLHCASPFKAYINLCGISQLCTSTVALTYNYYDTCMYQNDKCWSISLNHILDVFYVLIIWLYFILIGYLWCKRISSCCSKNTD